MQIPGEFFFHLQECIWIAFLLKSCDCTFKVIIFGGLDYLIIQRSGFQIVSKRGRWPMDHGSFMAVIYYLDLKEILFRHSWGDYCAGGGWGSSALSGGTVFIIFSIYQIITDKNEIQTTPAGENADNWRQNEAGAVVQEQRIQPFLYVTHHRQPFLLFDHHWK